MKVEKLISGVISFQTEVDDLAALLRRKPDGAVRKNGSSGGQSGTKRSGTADKGVRGRR